MKENFRLIITVENKDETYCKSIFLEDSDDWKHLTRIQNMLSNLYKEIKRIKL